MHLELIHSWLTFFIYWKSDLFSLSYPAPTPNPSLTSKRTLDPRARSPSRYPRYVSLSPSPVSLLSEWKERFFCIRSRLQNFYIFIRYSTRSCRFLAVSVAKI